jgi:hypothetical protein
MRRFWSVLGVLGLSLAALAAPAPDAKPLMKSGTVIWAGLDYSMVRMIGPGDFRDPDAIFPAMLDTWNELFLRERIRKVQQALRKEVILDTAGIKQRNRLATPKQIVPNAGADDTVEETHITEKEIADALRSYKLEHAEGLALAFIVDRLVKPSRQGAVYVVFFDARTREVLACERHVGPAAGAGFRNYWFRVIKSAESELPKHR